MMPWNLDGARFRVLRNDGPGAEVTTETRFHYHQDGDLLHAEYAGGGVRLGRLVGVVESGAIRHAYVQVNLAGELQSGHSTVQIRRSAEGRVQLVDEWEWQSREGRGICIMEETE